MRKILGGAMLVLALGMLSGCATVVVERRVPVQVVVTNEYDLYATSHLPKVLNLKVGDCVTFTRNSRLSFVIRFTARAKATDGGPGALLVELRHASIVRSNGLQVMHQFQAMRRGQGVIEVRSGLHVVQSILVSVN